MSNSISRQEAIDALKNIFDRCEEINLHLQNGDTDKDDYKMYPDYLTVWKYLNQDENHNVDTVPVVRGRWVDCDVYVTYREKWQKARCSHCDHYHITPHMMHSFEHFKYCPYCGARMEE